MLRSAHAPRKKTPRRQTRGAYSLLGRTASDALAATTGNFVRCLPLTALLSLVLLQTMEWDVSGVH